ncbi:hypothetical protein LINGRAHAP2_LOCUS11383 [Linum grandiflorum]
MMTTKVSSATIIFFVTLILLHTVSARNLLQEDSPTTGSPETGYGEEKDDGSKSGVHRSESRDSGSANGDRSPTAGTVQMPPPTAVTSVSYSNGGASNDNSNNNNYQPSSGGQYEYGQGGYGGSTQPELPPRDRDGYN